jgi:ubiquinone/menaquinone biosynthesis C-methylase UbiE
MDPVSFFVEKYFHPVYKRKVAQYIADLCFSGAHILDLGSGDGYVSSLIKELKPSVRIVGADIHERSPSLIPRIIYDGHVLPYPDNYFDIVICVDCLHHTENIAPMLQEMKRVVRKYIIIKDHTASSFWEKCLLRFSDYSTNFCYKIKCTYNFPSMVAWENLFKYAGLRIVNQPRGLQFGFGITDRFNPIFKLSLDADRIEEGVQQ